MALDMFPLSEILSSESWIANSLISSNNQVKYQFINEAFPEHPIRNNTVPAPPSSLPYLFWQNIENCAFSAGGMGLIPGHGTKTLHTKQHGKKKKRKSCSLSSHCQYPKTGFYYPLNCCSGLSNAFFHSKPYWAISAAGNNGFKYLTALPKMVNGFLWPVA